MKMFPSCTESLPNGMRQGSCIILFMMLIFISISYSQKSNKQIEIDFNGSDLSQEPGRGWIISDANDKLGAECGLE